MKSKPYCYCPNRYQQIQFLGKAGLKVQSNHFCMSFLEPDHPEIMVIGIDGWILNHHKKADGGCFIVPPKYVHKT